MIYRRQETAEEPAAQNVEAGPGNPKRRRKKRKKKRR
jgi:hypothetical protein